ncbi:class I SAM-dependent methyltransferase [Natronolimnohabitans sp. A-GB9]|uniref:class I SAM-dependent methyltransferase n=1 Tax=Natronolimnohabitans sp. A-GB9 TaxID=3069757 RepID=UPI0027ADC155|nr:class I SAM-dependent methyltransferase [Natronolimnohabitans sp. A-GB9]MDQ2051776.1 class I SAM-dependent methyltransferase [Natronolimnohabitans sp. A-GB9]
MFRPRYYFGVYHWRRRLRSIAAAAVVVALATVLGRRTQRLDRRLGAAAIALAAVGYGGRRASRLVSPPPWHLERYKYDALASRLPLDRADRILDVGCGTGRSLVGLAPHVPNGSDGPDVLGIDVFDDRVILGNGPQLARRNADRAGLAVDPIAGDAARLPLDDGAVDVVTACRVLHDLPEPAAEAALRECRRVCRTDGTVGILELPLLPDGADTDPDGESNAPRATDSYWLDRITAAGFTIDTAMRLERTGGGEPYLIVVASPESSSSE